MSKKKNADFLQCSGFTVERVGSGTTVKAPLDGADMKSGWYWVIEARDAFHGPFKSRNKAEMAGMDALAALESAQRTTDSMPANDADDKPAKNIEAPVLAASAVRTLNRAVGNKRNAPATELVVVRWRLTRCETTPDSAFKRLHTEVVDNVLTAHEYLVACIASPPEAAPKTCVAVLRRTRKGKYKLVRAFGASNELHASDMFASICAELTGAYYMLAPQDA